MGPASHASAPAPVAGPAVPARPRVLVADDSTLNRHLLRAILDQEGCEVLEAADGDAALAVAATGRPDLVLLDIVMPGQDGYAVCAALKADAALADVPVIFLSSLSETADKLRGLELGAVDYVTKPFEGLEVRARVRNQLQIRALNRSLQQANLALRAKQDALDADLRAAAGIQASLMPAQPPSIDGLVSGFRFEPCDAVGGDLFDLQRLDADHVLAFMVDVSGHGVPAAMVTVAVSDCLAPDAGVVLAGPGGRRGTDAPGSSRLRAPDEVVRRLDAAFPIERFDRYFTMCYLLLHTGTGEVRYCNAAHPPPVVLRAGGGLQRLERGGTLVGLGGVLPFEEGRLRLDPGDRLFLYTDGVIERSDGDEEPFGEARLLEALASVPAAAGVQAACDALMEAQQRWAGGRPPADDITVLGLEFRGSALGLRTGGAGAGGTETGRRDGTPRGE